jgi:uncharacterized integral membrane protein (TIGR00698 family)
MGQIVNGTLIYQRGALWRAFVPFALGLLIFFAIALPAKKLSGFAHLSPMIIALIIGMIIRNTVGLPPFLLNSAGTYELWLNMGIIFLGSQVSLHHFAGLGGKGVLLVVFEIVMGLALVTFLAKVFNLPRKLSKLMALGISVCGVTSIMGSLRVIDAEEGDASYAVTMILTFGAIALVIYPLIGHFFGMGDRIFGFWAGMSIGNAAEAVGTGLIYSDSALKYATISKLCRNIFLGPVILYFAISKEWESFPESKFNFSLYLLWCRAKFLWTKFPKFVIAFLAFFLLSILGVFTESNTVVLENLYKWCFVLAFAGIGLRTDIRALIQKGFKPFLVGMGAEIFISVTMLTLIYVCYG